MDIMDSQSIEDIHGVELLVEGNRKLSVRVLRAFPRSETTIFLIHGSMASMTQYNRLIEKLKSFYINIIAYDAYGCGSSDKPHDYKAYSTQEHLNDLIAVFEKYSTIRNILIGHSFGTSQVAKLCHHIKTNNMQPPDSTTILKSIDAIILLSTTFSIKDGGHPIFNLPIWILKCLGGYLSRQFVAMAYSPSTSESIKKESLILSGSNDMFVVKAFYQQMKWANIQDWSSLNKYPLLILQGADDKITPVEGAEQLVQELNSLKYEEKKIADLNVYSTAQLHNPIKMEVVEQAGHQIMIEKTDQVFEIIKQFLVNANVLSEKVVVDDINAYWKNTEEITVEMTIPMEVDQLKTE